MQLSKVTKPAFQAHTQWADDAPTKILLIRHGETDWNVKRIIQGWRGTSLNALGLRQAKLMAKRVLGLGLTLDAILCSDLKRAAQTADALARPLKLKVQHRKDLRERSFGDWEGKRVEDVLSKYRLGPGVRKDPFLAYEPNGGESMAVFSRRMLGFMKSVVREHAGQTVAAVTHGGPVRIAACLATGIDPKQYFVLGRPGNVSLTLLAHQGGVWWVEYYNDMAHLELKKKAKK
jgi:broad specificity phosphatase PhoE